MSGSFPSFDPAQPAALHFSRKVKMTNIFVGNLSFHTTEQNLRALFEQFGTVDRVSLVTDRETGKARGFGFVEMAQKAEAENAIASLNGRELDGRAINVNEARPKEDRGGGGGGGYRGRSGGGGGGGRQGNRW
ncbi:MAG: RNA-binding protein [Acidobacteria bacterium]|nr:RNA-binding protein [Acidobacteriota bacterium]